MQSMRKRREPGTLEPGMWVVHNGNLAVLFKIPAMVKKEVERDVIIEEDGKEKTVKRKVLEDFPQLGSVEVHYVDAKGETSKALIVPEGSVRQATYAEIKKQPRASHVTLAQAWELGYDNSDAGKRAAETAQAERVEAARKLSAKVEFKKGAEKK